MEDWEAKYWKIKQQQKQQQQNNSYTRFPNGDPNNLPHYKPAHTVNNSQHANNTQNGWRDIDPITAMYTNMDGLQSRNMGPQSQVVYLRPGAKYFKAVQADSFGTTMPLVRNCGVYSENIQREFELKNQCRCYIIDQLQSVDLSNPDPNRMVELIEVRAPMVGTILVEKNSIISPKGEPGILKG